MTGPLLLEVEPRRARADLLPSLALRDEPALGRPRGEVADALLAAMDRLATPERAPTLLELAQAAQVGRLAARHTLGNLVRRGVVQVVRRRWVVYRRSPVAEYALVPPVVRSEGPAHLAQAVAAMARAVR